MKRLDLDITLLLPDHGPDVANISAVIYNTLSSELINAYPAFSRREETHTQISPEEAVEILEDYKWGDAELRKSAIQMIEDEEDQ